VWKPRELGESSTLPRKKKSNQEQFETRTMVRKGEKKDTKRIKTGENHAEKSIGIKIPKEGGT